MHLGALLHTRAAHARYRAPIWPASGLELTAGRAVSRLPGTCRAPHPTTRPPTPPLCCRQAVLGFPYVTNSMIATRGALAALKVEGPTLDQGGHPA